MDENLKAYCDEKAWKVRGGEESILRRAKKLIDLVEKLRVISPTTRNQIQSIEKEMEELLGEMDSDLKLMTTLLKNIEEVGRQIISNAKEKAT